MIKSFFRNPLFISILGHITVFSVFSFSFGSKVPPSNFSGVCSLGTILGRYDLIPVAPVNNPAAKRDSDALLGTSLSASARNEYFLSSAYNLKPQVSLAFKEEKPVFSQKISQESFGPKAKEKAIMFYPHLPYNFLFFFKDRQAVHIELMYKVSSLEGVNLITVKRKISSGNLDADLLSMRYIGHYLFLQHAGFPTDNWQTVKIDLSAKND